MNVRQRSTARERIRVGGRPQSCGRARKLATSLPKAMLRDRSAKLKRSSATTDHSPACTSFDELPKTS